MKLIIKLLRPFSKVVGKNELVLDFKGSSIEDLLNMLVDSYPKLRKELYTKTNELTEYVTLFVNDKPMSVINGLATKLKNNDEILLFMPVSGG